MPNGYAEARASPESVKAYMARNPGMNYETAANKIVNMAGTTSGRPVYGGITTTGQRLPPVGGPAGGGQSGGGSGSGSAAQQWLNDVLSGKNLPFNAQVQAQQISQASDMNAAGEAARNGQIDANAAAGGASAHDPSLQGAKASNFARRQTENQQAARDISERGTAQNYAAQRSAAGELNGDQMQRDSWAQQAAMQREGWQHQQSMASSGGRGGNAGGGWGGESRNQFGGGFAFLPTSNNSQRDNNTNYLTTGKVTGYTPGMFDSAPEPARQAALPQKPVNAGKGQGQPNGIWAGPPGTPPKKPGPSSGPPLSY